jgi:hypothetical protein
LSSANSTNLTFEDLLYVYDLSLFSVQVQPTGSGPEISWRSVSNLMNHVEFTTAFPPAWQRLVSTNGTGEMMRVIDSEAVDAGRFYRVRVDEE